MTPPKFISDFAQYMYNAYSKDGGKLLVHLGAASWAFGAIAQIGMLLGDKTIDKDQKKFLLPQEAADAAVNVGMYYSICELIKRGGDKLVEKGKLLTDDVVKEIVKIKPTSMGNIDLKDWQKVFTQSELRGNLTELLAKAQELDIIKNASPEDKKEMLKAAKSALKNLEIHKNNVGIVSAIGASILACNVITPIVRNEIASKVQKNLQHKEAVEIRKTQIKHQITMKSPLPHSFKAFNNYNSFAGIKVGNL